MPNWVLIQLTFYIPPNLPRALGKGAVSSFKFCFGLSNVGKYAIYRSYKEEQSQVNNGCMVDLCSFLPHFCMVLITQGTSSFICKKCLTEFQCPSQVSQLMASTESFTKSGQENCGQGADFLHEETNKFIKGHVSPATILTLNFMRN